MTAGESDDNQKSKLDMESSNPAGKATNPTLTVHELTMHPGRKGKDADMAACILFLAGPGGLFLNNQVIYPDGGA